MSYAVTIVADSIGEHGKRLTTLIARYPRFIHSEMLRHRWFSHSVPSSRAIPTERLLAQVKNDPFVPEFNQRVKGMGVGALLDDGDQRSAQNTWRYAARKAAESAELLMELGVDKSRANRLLEPFMWVNDLITATEWDNFLALRDHHGAQKEFQIIARMIREALEESTPRALVAGDWHLPFVGDESEDDEHPAHADFWQLVSAGRCFVASYDRLSEITDEPAAVSYQRADRGKEIGHWSPMEHQAECLSFANARYGNLLGWRQLRKFYPVEDDFSKVLAGAKDA